MSRKLLDNFVSRLNIVKEKSQEEIVCHCPCCGPNDQSGHLYVKDAGDRLLISDQRAGHTADEICASIGLSVKDLFEPRKTRTETREHTYHNSDGSIFGKKVITKYCDGTKGCYWLRYENGDYLKGLQGKKAPLFDIHKLVSNGDDVVFFLEGEKDVCTLQNMGYVATSAPNGGNQKKWLPLFNDGLKDKTIYVLTDNDETGREYGEFVAKNVCKIAKSVFIIPSETILPGLMAKGDISDIARQIGFDDTREKLTSAMEQASPYEPKNEQINDRKTKKSDVLTIDVVREIADNMGVSIKLNLISNKVEISGLDSRYSKQNSTNTLPTLIQDFAKKHNLKGTAAFIRESLGVIADENRYNPILKMLQETKWDGRDRISEYINMLHIEEPSEKMYVRKWLHQTIALANNDESNPFGADGVLTFFGEQGQGKSTALRVLCPRPEWFGEGVKIDMERKDSLIVATQKWVVELGEADETTRKEQASLKAFLTSATDEIRVPYAAEAVWKPRRTSFCATVNAVRFLPADDGSRRWWIVHTGQIDYKKLLSLSPEWFAQLWKQTWETLYLPSPQGFRLTDEERARLQFGNAQHKKILPGELEVLDRLDFSAPESFWKWWRVSSLREILRIYNVTTVQLGRALTKISQDEPKIRTKTVHKVTSYFLPPFRSDGPEM